MSGSSSGVVDCGPNGGPGTRTRIIAREGQDGAQDAATDNDGNLFVVGITLGSIGDPNNGQFDVFLLKYDPDGLLLWAHTFGTSSHETEVRISLDQNGNAYISGATFGAFKDQTNRGGSDIFVAKYSNSGSAVWITQLGSAGSDYAYDIVADTNGNYYLVGNFGGNIPPESHFPEGAPFLMKASGVNGAVLWSTQFAAQTARTVDLGDNAIVLAGITQVALDGNSFSGMTDIYIAKYDLMGNKEWLKMIGTPGSDDVGGISVSGNDVYITGTISGSTDFDGNPLPANTNTNHIAKFSIDDGAYSWSVVSASANQRIGNDVAATANGAYYVGEMITQEYPIDMVVSAITKDGDLLWETSVHGPDGSGERFAVTVVPVGVAAVGLTQYPVDGRETLGDNDALIVVYNQDGCRL